jgi:MFS transporter, CP family, cyanate transporter
VSTALPALAAVPVATAFGWRASLAVWAVLALTALGPWIIASRARSRVLRLARESDDADAVESEPALEGRMFRSPVAVAIMIVFAVSSINAYATFAWLPSVLVDTAHISRAGSGALLALYGIVGFPSALIVPAIASRMKNVGILICIATASLVASDVGLILAPATLSALWVVLAGFGAFLFPLSLFLINRRTRTHVGSVALSGFVQGIGYLIAVASPLAFGLLHQASGSWTASLLLLLVATVSAVPAAIILRRPRYLEDDLAG